MKECIYCGAALPDEAKACSNCGRPLPMAENISESESETQNASQVNQPQSGAGTMWNQPEQNGQAAPWNQPEQNGQATPWNQPEQNGQAAPWSQPEQNGQAAPWGQPQQNGQTPWGSAASETGNAQSPANQNMQNAAWNHETPYGYGQWNDRQPYASPDGQTNRQLNGQPDGQLNGQPNGQNQWNPGPNGWVPQGQGYGVYGAPQHMHGMAVASLIMGVLSLFLNSLYFIPSLLAIGFGIAAILQIRKNPHYYKGSGLAIAGIVLGAVFLIVYIGLILWALHMMQDPEFMQLVQQYMEMMEQS